MQYILIGSTLNASSLYSRRICVQIFRSSLDRQLPNELSMSSWGSSPPPCALWAIGNIKYPTWQREIVVNHCSDLSLKFLQEHLWPEFFRRVGKGEDIQSRLCNTTLPLRKDLESLVVEGQLSETMPVVQPFASTPFAIKSIRTHRATSNQCLEERAYVLGYQRHLVPD